MDQLQLPLFEEITETKTVYIGPYYPFLENQLQKTISGIQTQDPLKPVIVLIPSMILAVSLRRKIKGGGINFYNFKDLSGKMAESYFHKNNILPVPHQGEETLARRAIEKIVKKTNSLFPFSKNHGFLKVFMSLLKDFRQGNFDSFQDTDIIIKKMQTQAAIEQQQINPGYLTTVFTLLQEFRKGFQKKYFDVEDTILQGSKAADKFKHIFDTNELILYGFYHLDEAQKKLVEQLGKYINLSVFLPYKENNKLPEDTLQWLKDRNFTTTNLVLKHNKSREINSSTINNLERIKIAEYSKDSGSNASKEDSSFRILSCPDEYDEIKEITRSILEIAKNEDIPFEQIAVILRKSDRYGQIIRQIFNKTGIPYYYHDGFPPDETASGMCLKLLLNLMGGNYPRFKVIELATRGMLNLENIFKNQTPVPSQWDRISCDAGITEGYDLWERRLVKFKRKLEKKFSRLEEEQFKRNLEKDIEETENLLKFVRMLHEDFTAIKVRDSWKEYIKCLFYLFKKYIIEDNYTNYIFSSIKKLEELDNLQEEISLEDFKMVISDFLKSDQIKEGNFLHGCVNIFNSRTANGITFPVIFFPGLISGEMPAPPSENPLFLDSERKLFNDAFDWEGKLPYRKDLAYEDPILFSMIKSSCLSKLIFTFPRTQSGSNADIVPSPYILEMGKTLTGKEVFYKDLHKIPGFRFIKKRFSGNLILEESIDPGEFKEAYLRSKIAVEPGILTAALEKALPSFHKSLDSYRNRKNRNNFTSYDGKITNPDLLSELSNLVDRGKIISSPTHIERYYLCPYRFLMEKVIGLQKLEAPEEIRKISPIDRGKLYHDIFYRFLQKLQEKGLFPFNEELRETYMDTIREIAREAIGNTEEMGITGSVISWFEEQLDLMEGVNRFVDEEINSTKQIPSHFEFQFGDKGETVDDGIDETEYPGIELSQGKYFRYRGRIDRIDIDPDGKTCTVIDYKTGKLDKNTYKSNSLKGGRLMQLPLYLAGIRDVLSLPDKASSSRALYYFATNRGEFKKVEFSGSTLIEREEDIKRLISGVLEESSRGIFIPYPGKEKENCSYCDFKTICPTDIDRIFSIKEKDPDIRTFIELKEIE